MKAVNIDRQMVEIIFPKSDENKYLCLNGIIKVRCYG